MYQTCYEVWSLCQILQKYMYDVIAKNTATIATPVVIETWEQPEFAPPSLSRIETVPPGRLVVIFTSLSDFSVDSFELTSDKVFTGSFSVVAFWEGEVYR